MKYRQAKIRRNLEIRARIIREIRIFFEKFKYLEIETPIRIPVNAPELNICAQESGAWFLHTSPELCMKRFLAAGYNKIFQICKCFRKFERGFLHLPEITLLEWYESGLDYFGMMDRCEMLLKYLATELQYDKISYKDKVINILASWKRITVKDLFQRYSSIKLDDAVKLGKFDDIMALDIGPKLGNDIPVFVYNYPKEFGSLAKTSSVDSSVVERFELYCGGLELCNAFTELTDFDEQKYRFELEIKKKEKIENIKYILPESFLNCLKDLPPCSGSALGIDRLIMLFTNAKEIDEVVSFIPEELL